jgi:uncharacterized membrane protein HdeD (DUF308 family)
VTHPSQLEQLRDRWVAEIDSQRGQLFAIGLGCLALGIAAMALPFAWLGSVAWLLGLVLVGSGLLKSVQLLPGRSSKRERRNHWPLVIAQVAIDLGMGGLLMNARHLTASLFAMALAVLFLIEGLVLFWLGLRSPTVRSRILLCVCGLAVAGCGVAILFHRGGDPIALAGFLVGLKLVLFGICLLTIAIRAPRPDAPLLFEPVVPETAELYAVYFGTAFHLGVYLGEGQVVHYLNDDKVYHLTWEQFLDGREPQHWVYPDLESVPAETVIATALAKVGATYPYSLIKFNCENFAIYCKSGGKTTDSRFAQVSAGVRNVAIHPLLGMVVELNTRIFEWLAFTFGGTSGKKLSLAIRQVGATVTTWLLAKAAQKATPVAVDSAVPPHENPL